MNGGDKIVVSVIAAILGLAASQVASWFFEGRVPVLSGLGIAFLAVLFLPNVLQDRPPRDRRGRGPM